MKEGRKEGRRIYDGRSRTPSRKDGEYKGRKEGGYMQE
jgi:hypothetical protein